MPTQLLKKNAMMSPWWSLERIFYVVSPVANRTENEEEKTERKSRTLQKKKKRTSPSA